MMTKRIKYLLVVLLVVVTAAVAGGSYYFTHRQEIAKLYTNSEFMSKYARYTQMARQLVTFNMNFKDSNIDVFCVRQLVAEDNATQRTIMFSAKNKKNFSVEYQKKSGFNSSKTVKSQDVSFKDGKDSYIEYFQNRCYQNNTSRPTNWDFLWLPFTVNVIVCYRFQRKSHT